MTALREPWILAIAAAFLLAAWWRGLRLGSTLALGTFLGALGRATFAGRMYRDYGEATIYVYVVSAPIIALALAIALLIHRGRPTAFGPWVRGKRALVFHGLVLLAGLECGRELLRMAMGD